MQQPGCPPRPPRRAPRPPSTRRSAASCSPGWVAGTQAPPVSTALLGAAVTQASNEISASAAASAPGKLTLLFRPDPTCARRQPRQQRLAPGAAQADLQADLGQTPLMLSPRTAERLKLEMEEIGRGHGPRRPQGSRRRCGFSRGSRDDTAPAASRLRPGRTPARRPAPASTPIRCVRRRRCGRSRAPS